MTVSPLAPELIYIILGSLPLDNMSDRTQTLLTCSLVNQLFREVAQRELGKHIYWLSRFLNRAQAFLGSPSCAAHWAPESIWIRQAKADDVISLLTKAASVRHLSLFSMVPEDRESGAFERVPEEALGSLEALRTLTLGRILINLSSAPLANLHSLRLTAGAFSPSLTPALLAAAPNLHTLALDLSSSAALAALAATNPATLASLRTLDILDAFVDEMPPLPSMPDEQLDFTRGLPALRKLRHNWLYPAHVEQVLGALPAAGTLEELEVRVFVDGEDELQPRLGRVLREAGGRAEVRRLRRWMVATMDPATNAKVGPGWMDDDYEAWRKGCEQRGTEVVVLQG